METNIIQEIELKYKSSKKRLQKLITTPDRTYEALKQIWNPDTISLFEEFKILYLNRSNHIIGVYHHSKGGINGTVADVRLVIGMALKCAASGIVLAHNHPSGNIQPSDSDRTLTKKILHCCELFDILLLDHIIVTSDDYFSFRDNGLF